MVTLALLKLLEDNGFGKIDVNLFWQKFGNGKNGVYISDIGENQETHGRLATNYELLCRGENDVDSYKLVDSIREFLADQYASRCTLPTVKSVDDSIYSNVTILPPSTVSSVGVDANHRMVYSITGKIFYNNKKGQ